MNKERAGTDTPSAPPRIPSGDAASSQEGIQDIEHLRAGLEAEIRAFEGRALASADILTNGTKVGMKPLENESLVNDISLLHPGLLVTECVYNPHMTKLLQQAQQAGCKTIDGYGMLLWQGAEQFTLWTGKDFPLEYVKQVMGFGA